MVAGGAKCRRINPVRATNGHKPRHYVGIIILPLAEEKVWKPSGANAKLLILGANGANGAKTPKTRRKPLGAWQIRERAPLRTEQCMSARKSSKWPTRRVEEFNLSTLFVWC